MKKIINAELPAYTFDDYAQWKGEWELINGIPYSKLPVSTFLHQAIASAITFSLSNSIKNIPECFMLSQLDWKINESTVVRPDVVLSCHDSDNDFLSKRPEIIFEILSKSSIKMDQETKFRIYQEEKVPYYIIVNPDDLKASIYKLENNEYSKQGDFNREHFDFDDLSCDASVDFNEVFKRFR